MAHAAFMLFAVMVCVTFLITFPYLAAFAGDLALVPRTIEQGGAVGAAGLAIPVDLGLTALFGLQQSVTTRPVFGRRAVPAINTRGGQPCHSS